MMKVEYMIDYGGALASFACLLHCLIAPLILLLLPTLGSAWSNSWVHVAFAILVLPLGLTVVVRGALKKNRIWMAVLGVIGVVLILLSVIPVEASTIANADVCCPTVEVTDSGSFLQIPKQSWMSMIGSLCLVAAHVANLCSCFRYKDNSPCDCGE